MSRPACKVIPVLCSPAVTSVVPAEKNNISTSLSRPLIYESLYVTDELPVALDTSSPRSSRDNVPKGESNVPGALLRSEGCNAGEASTESLPLNGGCDSPMDLAMQDMTSSLRLKSSGNRRPLLFSPVLLVSSKFLDIRGESKFHRLSLFRPWEIKRSPAGKT